jgi:cellulose synthase/poly-beta-1,6-N-acetylglucosamine synthase-like glycosyltransferase
MASRITVSVGIFCHNEEQNVAHAIGSVLASEVAVANIKQVWVVSSGSWDKTNRIVRKFAKKDKRVRLLEEVERGGKSQAINLFLTHAKAEVLMVMSGDLRVHRRAIEEMTLLFLNSQVGMVGAHPVPVNWRFSSVGKEMKLMWELHHRVSLQQAKCGEMVAFRRVIRKIPHESAVDEANLEVLMRMIGYSVRYAPLAVVYNKVPLSFVDVLTQRRRVESGHRWLMGRYNYAVSTMNYDMVLKTLVEYLTEHPGHIMIALRLVLLELLAKVLGWLDYAVLGKNPFIWRMVKR